MSPPESHFVAILFDIDGTLINSGGAGAASWRMAFDELYAIPADIGLFTDSGMTDPDVGRQTYVRSCTVTPAEPSSPSSWSDAFTTSTRLWPSQRATGSWTASRTSCRGS